MYCSVQTVTGYRITNSMYMQNNSQQLEIAFPGVHCTNQHRSVDRCKTTRCVHNDNYTFITVTAATKNKQQETLLTYPFAEPSSSRGKRTSVQPSNISATLSFVTVYGRFLIKTVRWSRSSPATYNVF